MQNVEKQKYYNASYKKIRVRSHVRSCNEVVCVSVEVVQRKSEFGLKIESI